MRNIDQRAYQPVPKRYDTKEEFIANVEEKLVSEATKNLRGVVDLLKPDFSRKPRRKRNLSELEARLQTYKQTFSPATSSPGAAK